MDKRTRSGVIIAFVSILVGWFLISDLKPEKRETFSFLTMGTAARFSFYGSDPDTLSEMYKAGQKAFDDVICIANLYAPDSELVRLNKTAYAKEFICSDLLWQMILEAEKAFYFSEGAFDITVKPLMDLWGFYRKKQQPPSDEEIRRTLEKVGFKKLILDRKKKTLRFSVDGMALDLGGIAKGFALDLAAEKLAAFKVRGVLDLGGNLKFLGGRKVYRAAIKDPARPERLVPQILEVPPGYAVSTSGDYERKVLYGGRTYGHIIDPVKGYPPPSECSATVVLPSAACADWLSTAVFLKGKSLAEKAEKQMPCCRVILVKK